MSTIVRAVCNACKARPRGIDGHEDIHIDKAPGASSSAAFKCSACGTAWTRDYVGSGVFSWAPLTQPD